ncbi:type II secretion system protein [Patescibacteria group bacterium]
MKKKGFTLIELLVVIAIIGILSTIGLVALNGAREKARDAQRKSDLAQVRTALALYYDDNSFAYPDQEGTAATDSDCINGDGTQLDYDDTNDFAGAIANPTVFKTAGALITTYLGSELLPPTSSAADGWSYYCYDTDDANGNSSYLLFTQTEGGATPWYWLDSEGGNGEEAAATLHTACSAATCTWD